jgi:glucose dehydrogenase
MESLEAVISACAYALAMNAVSKDVILNALFRKNDQPTTQDITTQDIEKANANEEEPQYLELKHIPKENCRSYDQLLSAISIGAVLTEATHIAAASIRRASL